MRIALSFLILLGSAVGVASGQTLAEREARLRALVPFERMVVLSPGTTREEYNAVMRELAVEQSASGNGRQATRRQPSRPGRPREKAAPALPVAPARETEQEASPQRHRRHDESSHDRRDDGPAPVSTPAVYTPARYTPPSYTPPSYTPPSYTPPTYAPPSSSQLPNPEPAADHRRGGSANRYVDLATGRVCIVDKGVLFCAP